MALKRSSVVSMLLWFACLAGVAMAFAFLRGLNDSDLFWHLRTGELVVASGRPLTADPYSFTYADGAWVPHEWLGQLLMYLSVEALGPDVSLGLFSLALPLGFLVLGLALVARGVPVFSVVLATLLPAMVAFPYASVRPQVISWCLLATLLGLLIVIDSRRWPWLFATVPLFVVWANVHGLYVIGLAVLGWYVLWTFAGRTALRQSRLVASIALLGAIAGSALTPAGLETLAYPLRYIEPGDWGLANIPEWSSPNFHDAIHLPLLLLIVALAVAGRGRAPGWLAGLAYIGVMMALVANRNVPVLAVLAMPTLAYAIAEWSPRLRRNSASTAPPAGRRVVEVGAVAALLVGCASVIAMSPGGIQLARFPTHGVDVLVERMPDARVLAEYGWGGYVAYRLHPLGGRVFVDGRNDMYPDQILEDYVVIRDAEPGWEKLIDDYRVEALLVRPHWAIVKVAPLSHWCPVYQDSTQALLLPCDDEP